METQVKMTIKNKIPGLFYTTTDNGVELPVLDVTHPLFKASINEEKLPDLIKEVEIHGEENAKKFQRLPQFLKKYFAKHSFVMAELLPNDKRETYLSGISTLMLKLGPWLIGKGKNRFLDRLASKALGGILLRMRVRDISHQQSTAAIPLLKKELRKNICFFNIAGGAASDSINSLMLIKKENSELLKGRKIEITILDTDSFGPDFADRCIAALKGNNGPFNDLDIVVRYIPYDWNDTKKLNDLLSERKDYLIISSSEGGVFEYCSEEIMLKHLITISENTTETTCISGSFLRDSETVDKGMLYSLKFLKNMKPNLLGVTKFKELVSRTSWKINSLLENNPRYIVFTLKK